jgi:cardiolipin synthase
MTSNPGKATRRLAAMAAALVTAVAATVAGCASLPEVVPDMGFRANGTVRVESGRGPLSAEQSKAILDRLKARGGETSIFDRHLALEEAIVGSPLIAGNKTLLLQDGPRTYEAMFAALRDARSHINLETYIFEDDEVGQRFADALIAKQKQGVQVHLLYDSVGSIKTSRDFFKRLEASGIKTVEYNPINPLTARKGWDVNQRDHRKLLIVDGRVAFLGGINISSVYSGSALGGSSSRAEPAPSDKKKPADGLPWRDTQLQIEGPVVAEFQKLFVQTWEKQKGPPLDTASFFPPPQRKGNEVVRAIGSSPDEPYSLIYATLISAIRSAEKEVFLTNAYFVPDPQLLAVLKEVTARGVDVRLLLPSKTDSGLVFHAGRGYYTELLENGIKIYERHDAMLHAKTALIDGVWSTVGSTNLDWRSFLHNDELNAVVLGGEFGNQMRQMFEIDLAASQQILLHDWKRRPIDLRIKELLSRMWQYWL